MFHYVKQFFSYLIPLPVKHYHSKIHGRLEVNLVNGRKYLDTAVSNYSFGSLQRILHRGLTEAGFNASNAGRILVLGMGAGSVVQTIRESFGSNAFIELVEFDLEIIRIAETDFGINRFGNIRITHADAFEYLQQSDNQFDLIVSDLFIGNVVPEKFTGLAFIRQLTGHLSPGGKIIYNTMRPTMTAEAFRNVINVFSATGLNVRVVERVEGSNYMVLAE
jgi:spermidine synthase